MGNTTSRAHDDDVVRDHLGRRYVAVHPGYASSPSAYRRALAGRITVCVLSSIAFILNIVGQVVPMYSVDRYNYYYGLVTKFYSMWQQWQGTATDKVNSETYTDFSVIFALIALGFNLIGLVLSAVLISTLPRHAEAQREDRANSEVALAKYGRLRQDFGDRDEAADAFPYTNLRVMNCGQAGDIPYETREEARRQYDRSICASALSMHIVASIFALTTVSLMGAEYDNEGYSYGYYYTSTTMGAGIPLFAVVTFLLVVTFILNAIPQLMGVMLCGELKPARCVLMVLDEESAAAIAAEQMRYAVGREGPLYTDMVHGVRVALPGPETNAAAAVAPAAGGYGGSPPLGGRGNGTDVEVPYAYTTANYYAAPPQLYSLSRDADTDAIERSGAGVAFTPGEATEVKKGNAK